MNPVDQVVHTLDVIEAECAKIKDTKPSCDICGKVNCNIVGATFLTDQPPCFCPNCKTESLKKTVFYKLCSACMMTDTWTEKILQKYVYN